MIIRFFSLTDDGCADTKAEELILQKFSDKDGASFENYADMSALLSAVGDALDTADVAVLAVGLRLYLDFKKMFIDAFGLETEISRRVSWSPGLENAPEELRAAHSLIPAGAVPLLTEDGLYTGFTDESEGQYIVLMPLEAKTLGHLLKTGYFPFLRKAELFGASEAPSDDGEELIKPFTPDTPSDNQQEPIEPLMPDTSSVTPGIWVSAESLAAAEKCAGLLRENYFKVGVPANGPSEYVRRLLSTCGDYEELFRFTPLIEDKGGQKPGEYAAQIAKIAREFVGGDIGASISNLCEEENEEGFRETFVFICVADGQKAVVRKLFANPGESEGALLNEAAVELLALIGKTASDLAVIKDALYDGAPIPHRDEDGKPVTKEETRHPVAGIGRAGVVATLVFLMLALMVSIVLGLNFSGAFGDTTNTSVSSSDTTADTLFDLLTGVTSSTTAATFSSTAASSSASSSTSSSAASSTSSTAASTTAAATGWAD